MSATPRIRLCRRGDLEAVTAIYNQAVMDGGSTADTAPVSLDQRLRWWLEHDPDQGHPVLVLEQEGRVLAFGSLSAYYDRPGYQETCELSYYVDRDSRGRGLGALMVHSLLERAQQVGMRLAVAIIFDDNSASKALLHRFGFSRFGLLSQAAWDRFALHDVSYWSLSLERNGVGEPV
ncbi:GNAT family N-acetyltransferase [Bifidobacterium sp. 7101]|uniref:GNAT family N-acetyltransferase n=1 Tax=Bifidobacterium sp. 7101 TaxID=1394175 RepID=UPI0004155D0C|nr:GNAT family N-acetyltransferase [Bifidobacterium sp. 7101]